MNHPVRFVYQLAFAIVGFQLLADLPSQSARSQEIPTSTHSLARSCVSDAGILLCTECRQKLGLAPILTPSNSDWRSAAREVTARIESRDPLNNPALEIDEDEDEDDDEDKKKQKRNKKKFDRKKKAPNNQPQFGSPLTPPSNPHPLIRPGMPLMPATPVPQQPAFQPPIMQPHHESPNHPEMIELLQNMNRTLKSIESLMRQDQEAERQQNKPNTHFVPQWTPTPQMQTPQPWPSYQQYPIAPPPAKPPQFEDRRNLGRPRNEMPRNDGPRLERAPGNV
jgi:hypothetical protein